MKQEVLVSRKLLERSRFRKNTVKKYIRNSEPLKFHKRKVPKKIDPYLEAVQEIVEKKIDWNAHLSRTSKNGLSWLCG